MGAVNRGAMVIFEEHPERSEQTADAVPPLLGCCEVLNRGCQGPHSDQLLISRDVESCTRNRKIYALR